MSNHSDQGPDPRLPFPSLASIPPFNSYRDQVSTTQMTEAHPIPPFQMSSPSIPLNTSGGPAPITPMTPINRLPLEVLRMIFCSLPKSDLKKLRYMSKALSQAVVPSLFDRVILAPSELDMEVAQNVLEIFGCHVTRLVLVCVNYQNLSFEQYRYKHQRRYGNYRTASKEDEKASFDEYEHLRLAQKTIEQDSKDVVLMRRALIAAPSIQTIEINDQWPSDAVQASYRKMALNQDCGFRDSPWDFPVLCPTSGYDLKHLSRTDSVWIRALTVVAQVLEVADYQIRTFRVSHAGALCLPLKALHHLRWNIGDQYKFFCYLRSLDLRLGVQDYQGTFEKPAGLVNLLKTATNLETFQLSFDEEAARVFRAVAAKVHFPQLKHLSLENCTADEESWITFFQSHGKTLRTLVGVRLTVDEYRSDDGKYCGKWENVLERGIRGIKLSRVEMRKLRQGSVLMEERFLRRLATRGL